MQLRFGGALRGVFLLLVFGLVSMNIQAVQCPAAIDSDDCVANDLQPTGSEVIDGPTHCTEGETFAATLRVLFEDGGGANERYNVGFFVGDNGESPIGGASCTFDSLQPVGDPIDLTGGSGGFFELNGDACGDISKSDPTYKDIQLDSILCKDDDGDGNVDVGYVLTWENNQNQANCQDPFDPGEFEPQPPKCLSDLEYDLPIVVEQPPSIDVGKGAFPSTLNEPGGQVTYAITIINTSPSSSDPVIIDSIVDDPGGDITDNTDCDLPLVLAPSQSITCNFTTTVTGVEGDIIPDTVTVTGMDDEGEPVTGSDTAEVEIVAPGTPPPPGDLRILKFASPSQINEPGGTVQYDVLVANVSPTAVTLNSLVDDLYGDLNGKGSCVLPQTLSSSNSIYYCVFQEKVTGQPGDIITDTIFAEGVDALPESNIVYAEDSASVEILNLNSDIELTKVATPGTVLEPGGNVVFSLQVQNISVVDEVTINALFDSKLGVPEGDCVTPFTLAPGGDTYTCSYSGPVEGNAGDVVTNTVIATGLDDDDQVVADVAAETVFIIGALPSIEVEKIAIPPIALTTGSTVRYVVGIYNTSSSADPVTITSLVDVVNGVEKNLDGMGSCELPDDGLLLEPDATYFCSWLETDVTGVQGVPLVDEVTATGNDDEGTPVSGSAEAVVNFIEIDEGVARLQLVKTASPIEVPEPGGEVTYTVIIANTSTPGDLPGLDLTITELDDDLYGDLDGKGTCAIPIVLAVDEFTICSFTEDVSGNVGDIITDTIIATATYGEEQTTSAGDDAFVTITDIPSSISLTKTANPTRVLEPGDDVTFTIAISNTSLQDNVTINSLVDSNHGDLSGQGDCAMPQVLAQGSAAYSCSFTVFVGGEPDTSEINIATASGVDDDGVALSAQDLADVAILNQPPSITAQKSAMPNLVPGTGGLVTFKFTTTNTSPTDVLELETLVDSVFGDLNGQGTCSVPQTLQPGGVYDCEFDAEVSGMFGDTHVDEIEVTGVSDDGDRVSARAQAFVSFYNILNAIPAVGRAGLAILLLIMGLFGFRAIRAKGG